DTNQRTATRALECVGTTSPQRSGVKDSSTVDVPTPSPIPEGSHINEAECALVWLDGDQFPRALALEGRVLVLGSEQWIQRPPLALEPGDQIVLPASYGDSDARRLLSRELMTAIDARNPDLISRAREWRRCLDTLTERE